MTNLVLPKIEFDRDSMLVLVICKIEANLKTRADKSEWHDLILLIMELDFLRLLVTCKIEADQITRNVTVCNKCPQRPLILTFGPWL